MKNENIPIGSSAGVATNKICFAAWEEKEELIPCDDELNRLKEFLAHIKETGALKVNTEEPDPRYRLVLRGPLRAPFYTWEGVLPVKCSTS